MATVYPNNVQTLPIDIIGPSNFGRYPKINIEKTWNMFLSTSGKDKFLVPYPGYKVGIPRAQLGNSNTARALFASTKLDKIVGVFGNTAYLITVDYDQTRNRIKSYLVTEIGRLNSDSGIVYVAENNKPQILFSDQVNLYIYDPSYNGSQYVFTDPTPNTFTVTSTAKFQVGDQITVTAGVGGILPTGLSASTSYYISALSFTSTTFQVCSTYFAAVNGDAVVTFSGGTNPFYIVERQSFSVVKTDFKPLNIIFHDTYFIVAANNDISQGGTLNNTWRLSLQNDGTQFPSDAQHVGLIETKPGQTLAVARIPSGGNLIFVMGNNVVEPWFNEGAQIFPYQRNDQYNSDYGCVSAATVCSMDEIVVWLGKNEKSGPIILVSTGTIPKKITTDGLDFLFSQLNNPADSIAFLYRQDGHLIYHINFYTDNQSFFYDFNTESFYNASNHNLGCYDMSQVVFYRNQYYSISPTKGELFIFDTVFYTYDDVLPDGTIQTVEIPRIRTSQHIRLPSQDYFIMNDVGFTIETGETDYLTQNTGPIYLTSVDNKFLTTIGSTIYLTTMDGKELTTVDNKQLIATQANDADPAYLVATQDNIIQKTPMVELSISYDGGVSFGTSIPYELFPIGKRINKLQWWQLGMANDAVMKFTFWNIGRVVCTDGELHIRT